MRRCVLLLLLLAGPSSAQDQLRVSSPNSKFEFQLGIAQPPDGGLSRLAYQVFYQGKPLIDLSYLGFDIRDQEPLLGENLGMIGSKISHSPAYSALVAEYMQNGSLGRRINMEVRAADDGVAFRYVIPRSTPLEKILIENELTEFALPERSPQARLALPLIVEQPGVGWVQISESRRSDYPQAGLVRTDSNVLMMRLPHEDHYGPALAATAPLTSPWRVVTVGASRESLTGQQILRALAP